ncbi:hypothetical protein [Streptomyces sp. AC558_RSS880]|uniref:hypothetical protein n=1 Tax=Streptomyces sp. AC558_RSS880 TaxID=2823687 RepID=UPI001C22D1EA|nr:hypothetical protein [Streptomyces sp. AC558_RSS880]
MDSSSRVSLFPDNTVLCNFGTVGRLDLLRKVLDGCGRWTEAVAEEARRSATYVRDLARLRAEGWLGEPIELCTDAEIALADRLRTVGTPPDRLRPVPDPRGQRGAEHGVPCGGVLGVRSAERALDMLQKRSHQVELGVQKGVLGSIQQVVHHDGRAGSTGVVHLHGLPPP